MPTLNQRGVVHIALILLLLAGLVASVYLVQQQQIFRPKASGGKVWLIDNSGNNLPQKDGGVYEVPGQEIRIFIHQPTVWSPPQPQGRLPNLVTAAYAQSSQCNGTVYSCSDIKCDDGITTAPGTGCYETGGDPNNRYRTECKRNCTASSTTGGTGSSGTTTNTGGTTADVSTPTITGASWDQDGSYLTITGSGFGNSQGTVYYSRGGSEQFPSQSVSFWSAGSIKIGAEIPLGSTRSVDNMIFGGNYLKVCRADGRCSAYWSPIPERPKTRVYVPTAPKAAPPGEGAPAASTQPQITEATQEIRISSVVDYVRKDGVCEGSEDPAKHCMRFSGDNPDSRYTFAALLTQGYVGWWLANTTEEQGVFVGFISNKGTNFVESIRVRIVRPQPTARPTPAGGGAPPPAKSTLDTLAGSPDVSCISGTAYQYPIGSDGVDTGYGCVCKKNNRDLMVVFITDKETGQDLVETGSSCTAPAAVSPAPVGPKPSCREVGICVKDTGDERGVYSESGLLCSGRDESKTYSCPPEYPICLTGTSCKAGCPSLRRGVCVNEERKTKADAICAGIDESGKYFCSDPAYPTCLTDTTCRTADVSSPTPTPTPSPTPRPTPTAVPTPAPAGAGSPDNPLAGMIYIRNNTGQDITIQKVEARNYNIAFWVESYTILDDTPTILTPSNYRTFSSSDPLCTIVYNLTGGRPIRVSYTDSASQDRKIAQGNYQCGGGEYGIVTIP